MSVDTWDCPFCKHRGNSGYLVYCVSCGMPRGLESPEEIQPISSTKDDDQTDSIPSDNSPAIPSNTFDVTDSLGSNFNQVETLDESRTISVSSAESTGSDSALESTQTPEMNQLSHEPAAQNLSMPKTTLPNSNTLSEQVEAAAKKPGSTIGSPGDVSNPLDPDLVHPTSIFAETIGEPENKADLDQQFVPAPTPDPDAANLVHGLNPAETADEAGTPTEDEPSDVSFYPNTASVNSNYPTDKTLESSAATTSLANKIEFEGSSESEAESDTTDLFAIDETFIETPDTPDDHELPAGQPVPFNRETGNDSANMNVLNHSSGSAITSQSFTDGIDPDKSLAGGSIPFTPSRDAVEPAVSDAESTSSEPEDTTPSFGPGIPSVFTNMQDSETASPFTLHPRQYNSVPEENVTGGTSSNENLFRFNSNFTGANQESNEKSDSFNEPQHIPASHPKQPATNFTNFWNYNETGHGTVSGSPEGNSVAFSLPDRSMTSSNGSTGETMNETKQTPDDHELPASQPVSFNQEAGNDSTNMNFLNHSFGSTMTAQSFTGGIEPDKSLAGGSISFTPSQGTVESATSDESTSSEPEDSTPTFGPGIPSAFTNTQNSEADSPFIAHPGQYNPLPGENVTGNTFSNEDPFRFSSNFTEANQKSVEKNDLFSKPQHMPASHPEQSSANFTNSWNYTETGHGTVSGSPEGSSDTLSLPDRSLPGSIGSIDETVSEVQQTPNDHELPAGQPVPFYQETGDASANMNVLNHSFGSAMTSQSFTGEAESGKSLARGSIPFTPSRDAVEPAVSDAGSAADSAPVSSKLPLGLGISSAFNNTQDLGAASPFATHPEQYNHISKENITGSTSSSEDPLRFSSNFTETNLKSVEKNDSFSEPPHMPVSHPEQSSANFTNSWNYTETGHGTVSGSPEGHSDTLSLPDRNLPSSNGSIDSGRSANNIQDLGAASPFATYPGQYNQPSSSNSSSTRFSQALEKAEPGDKAIYGPNAPGMFISTHMSLDSQKAAEMPNEQKPAEPSTLNHSFTEWNLNGLTMRSADHTVPGSTTTTAEANPTSNRGFSQTTPILNQASAQFTSPMKQDEFPGDGLASGFTMLRSSSEPPKSVIPGYHQTVQNNFDLFAKPVTPRGANEAMATLDDRAQATEKNPSLINPPNMPESTSRLRNALPGLPDKDRLGVTNSFNLESFLDSEAKSDFSGKSQAEEKDLNQAQFSNDTLSSEPMFNYGAKQRLRPRQIKQKNLFYILIGLILIAGAIIALLNLHILPVFNIFPDNNQSSEMPLTPTHEMTYTVTGHEWLRSGTIITTTTSQGEGWSLPPGANMIRSTKVLDHYEKVLDHYATKEVTNRKLVGHIKVLTGRRQLSNGEYEEVYETRPAYVNQTQTVRVPIYKNQPVYKTKYVYTLQSTNKSTFNISGRDKNPAWPSMKAGSQRVGTTEIYHLIVKDQKNTEFKIPVDYLTWQKMNTGDSVNLQETRSGLVIAKK